YQPAKPGTRETRPFAPPHLVVPASPAGVPASGKARRPAQQRPRLRDTDVWGAKGPDFIATPGASRPGSLAMRDGGPPLSPRRWNRPLGACLPALLHACSHASGSAGTPGLPLAEGAHAVRRSPCGHDGRGCLGTHWFHCVVEVGVPARKLASPASTRVRS